MYYKQSAGILKAIKKARRILINVHPHPDLDTVGSALALTKIINELKLTSLDRQHKAGQFIDIVCPEKIKEDFSFLAEFEKIKAIDFAKYDFTPYDLFLILDSSTYDRVTGSKAINLPKIRRIVIDHHLRNNIKAEIKLADTNASATAEILYKVFADWKARIDKNTATALFAGLAGDTVFFRYGHDSSSLFKIAYELIQLGADKDVLFEKFYNNYDLSFLKLLGKFLEKLKFDRIGKFVWSAISYEEYKRLRKPVRGQSLIADMFFRSVRGANFGFAILERRKGEASVSFRSKLYFDVSVLAEKLGGAGHKNAAGATLFGNFSEIVAKVLKTVKNSLNLER